MTKHHSVSHILRAGPVLLTLLVSLLITTHIVTLTHAASPTHVPLTEYDTYPISTVGRLLITLPTKKAQSCSGTALVSQNGSVVDTAAHCFFDPQSGQPAQANSVLFCPQYQNGTKPLGCWRGQQIFISSGYKPGKLNKINRAYDFALLVVALRSDGKKLQDGIGSGAQVLPQSMPLPKNNAVTLYGYPGGSPTYTGRELYSLVANVGTSGPLETFIFGPSIHLFGGAMETGSSGGPWFTTISGTIYIVGHEATVNGDNAYSPDFKKTGWFDLFAQAQQVQPTAG